METYKIEIKALADGTYQHEYHLDDNFFSAIEDAEVTKGDVRVQLIVKKIEGTFDFKFLLNGVVKVQCNRCRVVMVRKIKSRRHSTIDVYAPEGQEELEYVNAY